MSASRGKSSAVGLVGLFCLITVLTVAGFVVRPWLPPVASQHGEDVDFVINYLLVTTGIVFVVGHAALAWLVLKHSGREKSTYRPVSNRVEWMWALVPVVFMAGISEAGVLVLGGSVWDQLYGERPQDAIEVEVVGKQFEWFVRYPGKDGEFGRTLPELVHEVRNPLGLDRKDPAAKDDLFSRGVLRLPVDRTAIIHLRTHDVQHSFSVPSFRVKQDLVPGFATETRVRPIRTGQFEIACAELCGLGHYKMRGTTIVLSQEEFDAWLDQQIGWFE